MHFDRKHMKRISLFGILIALGIAFLGWTYVVDASPSSAKRTPTPTTTPKKQKRAKTRLPKATVEPTATPAPTSPLIDDTESADAVDVVPQAPGPMTSQILLFNPDGTGNATVQVDIYNTSGAVAYSTNVNVAKNGAQLVALPSSLGANFQGGAQISSDKNIQAVVIGANANNSARDSYEGSNAPALDVTLPFVRHLAPNTRNSIIAIQNTTGSQANVALTLYNPDGSVAHQENPVIGANQIAYLNTNTMVPSGTFLGSARVTSNQNVAVAMQSLYYRDTSAFLGMTASETDPTVYLNQVQRKANGKGVAANWSEIFARNNGNAATDITITFYSTTGAQVTSQTASNVAPNGMAQFLLNDAAFSALGNAYVGWAKVTSNGQPLAVSTLQVLGKGKRLYGENGIANTQTGTRYVCGDMSRSTAQNSTLTILNTDAAATARVQMRLFKKDTGGKVVKYKVNIAPNSSIDILLSDAAFAAAGTSYQGMAQVLSKGGAAAKLVVSVSNPYGSPRQVGTTGYQCSKY